MSANVLLSKGRPCVWMCAGLITYKLCDRDFDCERCPLDAALRGEVLRGHRRALAQTGEPAEAFPGDRYYSPGHTWIRSLDGRGDGPLRFGIDAFAAAVLGRCSGVRWPPAGGIGRRGEKVCELDLDLGDLPLGAPVAGRVVNCNSTLSRVPGRVVTDPYSEGWLLELLPDEPSEIRGLMSSDAARDTTRKDLQRFRRRVALHLLADADLLGPSLADGGELLTDLRQMLGGPRYLQLLQELVY